MCVARQRRYYGRHVSADKIVAADSPRLFIHADEPRRYYQRGSWDHSPAHRKRKICLPECPTIDGFRAPGHHQRAYSCAKRRKNLYSPSYFHILDQMMSLSGTAAWQVVRPPLSANGHVVSRDAYKPGANPIQAKLTYARWRANAASKHCTHSIGALPACSALLLHLPRRLGFRVFEQAAELPQVMEIQGPVPPTSPFPT